ncbi:hypothetical protein ACQKTA_04095 [Enterococcus sp. 22-H-5-01]|uniref:hypothetical protein n=1 Tax=Enterococcus sp. 22-H-5-01 TaxID=3418555 RepID=UPI003CFFA43C
MQDNKENYVKTIKNAIVTLSSIVFLLNIILSIDFLSILLNSFTYISSQGLTFFSLDPKTEKSKKRRSIMVNSAIWLIAVIVACLLVVNKIELQGSINRIVLNIVKTILIIFSMLVVYFSFVDGSETVTNKEKSLAKAVHKDLATQYEHDKNEKIYSERNKRSDNNAKKRSFIVNLKRKKDEKR